MPQKFYYQGDLTILGQGGKTANSALAFHLNPKENARVTAVVTQDSRENRVIELLEGDRLLVRYFVVDGLFGIETPGIRRELHPLSEAELPFLIGFSLPPGKAVFTAHPSIDSDRVPGEGCNQELDCEQVLVPFDLYGNDFLGRWNKKNGELSIVSPTREKFKWTFADRATAMPKSIAFTSDGPDGEPLATITYSLTKKVDLPGFLDKSQFVHPGIQTMVFKGNKGFIAPADPLTVDLSKYFDRQVALHAQVDAQRQGGSTWWLPATIILVIAACLGFYLAFKKKFRSN